MGALSESYAQLLLAREAAGLGMWNWDIAAGETHYSRGVGALVRTSAWCVPGWR